MVLRAGTSQNRIARRLKSAYADGLLSADTFAYRVDQLHEATMIDPGPLIGDLNLRATGRSRRTLGQTLADAARRLGLSGDPRAVDSVVLLALDWGEAAQNWSWVVTRQCDVVLPEATVSRRHARLLFRDGSWVLQDLESTNGTSVNHVRVGRCELRPGDLLVLGDAQLRVD